MVEVDFEEFPHFIDALGGVTVNNKTRICSPPFDNFWKGLHFKKGELHLDGRHALGYSRVRKNACAPNEDDRDRARRQQAVLAGIGSQAKSPSTFFRLPWVSWNAPRTLKSDMNGFQLMALFADMATGNSSDTEVLEATLLQRQQPVRVRGLEARRGRQAAERQLASRRCPTWRPSCRRSPSRSEEPEESDFLDEESDEDEPDSDLPSEAAPDLPSCRSRCCRSPTP